MQECMEVLVAGGADVNAQDNLGLGICHWAASQEAHRILKYALEKGARWDAVDGSGRTALHWCALADSSKCLSVVLKSKDRAAGSLDIQDHDLMTALHWATLHRKNKHVGALLKAKAATNLLDGEQRAPLHWAVEAQDGNAVAALLATGGDLAINQHDSEGRSVLHIAVAQRVMEIITAVCSAPGVDVNAVDSVKRTPLHWAAAAANTPTVALLLEHKADTSLTDDNGASAMHYAAQAEIADPIDLLLAAGALSSPDAEGRHPFHWAVMSGTMPVVSAFLAHKVDVNVADDVTGRTALHYALPAALGEGGNLELVTYLLQCGADANISDSEGR
jgi:ankyrin repeat protein